jgi:hypothetical protein
MSKLEITKDETKNLLNYFTIDRALPRDVKLYGKLKQFVEEPERIERLPYSEISGLEITTGKINEIIDVLNARGK